jgi:hypothetical protein
MGITNHREGTPTGTAHRYDTLPAYATVPESTMDGLLANSHRFAQSAMALEAGLCREPKTVLPPMAEAHPLP